MVSGSGYSHFNWMIGALAGFVGVAGATFYSLRKSFKKEVTDLPSSLPQKRGTKSTSNVPKMPVERVVAHSECPAEVEPELEVEVEAKPIRETRYQALVKEKEAEKMEKPSGSRAQIGNITSIHVSIWGYDHVLEQLSPEQAFDALNEFQAIGWSWGKKYGIIYEKSSGKSFYLHWVDEKTAIDALKIALELRRELSEWNDVRSAEHFKPFSIIMGADRGTAIRGWVGQDADRNEFVVGEATDRARAFSQIALSLGSEFLASEQLWSQVSSRYQGEKVVHVNLRVVEPSETAYKVLGTVVEETIPQPVSLKIEIPRVEELSPDALWRVNNGSQILGPMSVQDIARALFALDLDFDCECWEEGRGNRVAIENSGMFGNPTGLDARFWVFDGTNLHGPLSEEILKEGLGGKKFPRESYVCERSTLNGWKPLIEIRAALKEADQTEKVVNQDVKGEPKPANIPQIPPQFAPEESQLHVQLSAPVPPSEPVVSEPSMPEMHAPPLSESVGDDSIVEEPTQNIVYPPPAEVSSQAEEVPMPVAPPPEPLAFSRPIEPVAPLAPQVPQAFQAPAMPYAPPPIPSPTAMKETQKVSFEAPPVPGIVASPAPDVNPPQFHFRSSKPAVPQAQPAKSIAPPPEPVPMAIPAGPSKKFAFEAPMVPPLPPAAPAPARVPAKAAPVPSEASTASGSSVEIALPMLEVVERPKKKSAA
jgi:hypothetical protein